MDKWEKINEQAKKKISEVMTFQSLKPVCIDLQPTKKLEKKYNVYSETTPVLIS